MGCTWIQHFISSEQQNILQITCFVAAQLLTAQLFKHAPLWYLWIFLLNSAQSFQRNSVATCFASFFQSYAFIFQVGYRFGCMWPDGEKWLGYYKSPNSSSRWGAQLNPRSESDKAYVPFVSVKWFKYFTAAAASPSFLLPTQNQSFHVYDPTLSNGSNTFHILIFLCNNSSCSKKQHTAPWLIVHGHCHLL